MFQRLAFQIFHSYEAPAIMLTNLVDGADVRMIQCRGGTSLPAEPFKGLWVFRQVIRKEFQSNEAAELGVLSFIDHAHPATAKFFKDAVVGNCLPDEPVRIRHSAVILGSARRQVNEVGEP